MASVSPVATTPTPVWAGWPVGLRIGWAALAAGAAGVLWVLLRFWGANPEYADRLLIPAASGWLIYRMAGPLATLPVRPMPLGLLPLAVGAVAFPVGWYLLPQVGPKPVLLWWLTGAWLLAAVGLLLVHAGWPWLRKCAFPLAFLLFALPPPNRVIVPLQHNLQEVTTTAAAAVLRLGYDVGRSGFVLHMPAGDLGVAEACSGVRSVTALTAIAAFVAYLYGFGLLRGAALLLLALPVIAACNAARVAISGVLQEAFGPSAIEGTAHEVLGFAMVLLGLGLVLALARLIAPRTAAPPAASDDPPSPSRSPRGSVVAGGVMTLALAATVAAGLQGGSAVGSLTEAAALDQIPDRIGAWQGEDRPVPDKVRELLTYDSVLRRTYRNGVGQEVEVWVIFWTTRNAVKGYHHPDVCFPNRGWHCFDGGNRDVTLDGSTTVPVTIRRYERDGHRQLVSYWTQEGRRVWTIDDERAVQMAGDSHRWIGDRLTLGGRYEGSARLAVLMGTDLWGGYAEKALADFTQDFATELYRACPWARPEPPPTP